MLSRSRQTGWVDFFSGFWRGCRRARRPLAADSYLYKPHCAHTSSRATLVNGCWQVAMANYVGGKFGQQDVDKLVGMEQHHIFTINRPARLPRSHPLLPPLQREYEKRVDPNDKGAQALLEEMKQHVKKVRLTGPAIRIGAPLLCTHRSHICPVAAGGDAQERRPPVVFLHPRVQGSSKNLHRWLQGGGARASPPTALHPCPTSPADAAPSCLRCTSRETLASQWSGPWSRTTPGQHRSCASWTSRCVLQGCFAGAWLNRRPPCNADTSIALCLNNRSRFACPRCRWMWRASPGLWTQAATPS